jgi:hypothetical protein
METRKKRRAFLGWCARRPQGGRREREEGGRRKGTRRKKNEPGQGETKLVVVIG